MTQIARQRGSISAQSMSLQRQRTGSVTTIPRLHSDSNRLYYGEPGSDEVQYHSVEARARTAQLPPVMVSRASALPPKPGFTCHLPTRQIWAIACQVLTCVVLQSKTIDEHPLCWLGFEEDCIITSCQEGMDGPVSSCVPDTEN
jgi:catabolite repression protein CreC